jgi:cytochrome d ubiquinol oxidase subunit I
VEHDVRGLQDFPRESWPPNVELLYYAFHIMAGLGTLMMLVMLVAAFLEWRGRLVTARSWLWVPLLAFPAPYIATIAGWMVAEYGRQPWLVYGLMRTDTGASPTVHAGLTLFTTLGFAGVYLALGLLFVLLVAREIRHGPPAAQLLPEPPGKLAPAPTVERPPEPGLPLPHAPLTRGGPPATQP